MAPVTAYGPRLDALTVLHLMSEAKAAWFRVYDLVHANAEERICIDVPARPSPPSSAPRHGPRYR